MLRRTRYQGFADMGRSGGSSRWLQRQRRDGFVRRARQDGYRSRAAFKLLEIDKAYSLLRPGMTVLDLGAAPGSWLQVACAGVGETGLVVGVDMLDCAPVRGAILVRGDILSEETQQQVRRALQGRVPNLVLSDMAPNMSGVKLLDQIRGQELMETAHRQALNFPGSALVLKAFVGTGYDAFMRDLGQSFASVRACKPRASRAHSRETYLIAQHSRVRRKS